MTFSFGLMLPTAACFVKLLVLDSSKPSSYFSDLVERRFGPVQNRAVVGSYNFVHLGSKCPFG
jgi:hypothetical protein